MDVWYPNETVISDINMLRISSNDPDLLYMFQIVSFFIRQMPN